MLQRLPARFRANFAFPIVGSRHVCGVSRSGCALVLGAVLQFTGCAADAGPEGPGPSGGGRTGTDAPGGKPSGGAGDNKNDPSMSGGGGEDSSPTVLDNGDEILVDEPPTTPRDEGELVNGEVCNSKDVSFESLLPTLAILVDKSSSMFASNLAGGGSNGFGTFPDIWEALRDSLKALEPFSSDVAMSIATYTSNAQEPNTCPIMGNLDMVPATDNFSAIVGALGPSADEIPPGKGETPTGEAIDAVVERLLALPADGPKYILLATDGEPDSCARFDPQVGQDIVIAAVQAAYAAGIQTYVIGLGTEAGARFLNDVAHAGQGLEVAVPTERDAIKTDAVDVRGLEEANSDFYYPEENWRKYARAEYGPDELTAYDQELFLQPGDAEALADSLSKLVGGVRTCEFEMGTAVKRDSAGLGGVELTRADGSKELLTFEGPDGWMLSPDNDYTVVVQGEACDAILNDINGDVSLRIEFPCELQVPIIQ